MNTAALKNRLSQSSPQVMTAILLLQPLLDVFSYFMQQQGTTIISTALRTVLLFAVCAYGFVITEHRRAYLVLYSVLAGFWLLHTLNCLRLGYQDPVGDAAEYLKLIQFPLWTLVFLTICRQRPTLNLCASGLLAANFAIILLVIGLSYATGAPAYTYDIPARGVKLGLLGWFGVPNAQSAVLAMIFCGLLAWAHEKGQLWLFSLANGAGCAVLYFSGTRLAYYAAVLASAGFVVLIFLAGGRRRWNCVPLVVGLVLLLAFRGVSPMIQRRALPGDTYRIYQEQTDQVMGRDKDYTYTGGEIPKETREKITQVYEQVYGGLNFAGAPMLGDLLDRFGTQRVMEYYDYTTAASTLCHVRTKKIAVMAMTWEEQDLLTKLVGVEYAAATLNGTNYDPENDFPGLFYFYGWLGTGIYVAFAGSFLVWVLAGCVRNLRRLPEYLTVSLGAWAMIYVLGLGAAQYSGQVMRKPSVTVYMSLAAAQLCCQAQGSGKLFARVQRRPGVKMKQLKKEARHG